MKLFTYAMKNAKDADPKTGLFFDTIQKGIDLKEAYSLLHGKGDHECEQAFSTVLSLISSANALKAAREIYSYILNQTNSGQCTSTVEEHLFSLGDRKLFAPIPHPISIRDFFVFETHVRQSMKGALRFLHPNIAVINRGFEMIFKTGLLRPPRLWYMIPAYYKGNPSSVIGHQEEIVWPGFTEYLDYELEMGIYIGKKGCNIPRNKAKEFIGGYTIYNDISARDLQMQEMQLRLGPSKSKDFDTGNVMGPFLVTPDELKDPYSLEMIARVNGQEWSRGNSREMFYRFEDLIAYVSKNETLYPGDFFGSGTVGNGCGLEHGRWLQPGDVIELEVEGLGILKNRIVRR